MIIAYLIIVLVVSELGYQLASQQQMGIVPYPFGVTMFCMINHIIVLVTGIWYFGWVGGIILFALHFLSIIHSCFGWILSAIDLLLVNTPEQMMRSVRREVSLLSIISPAFLIFMIVSFFVVDFKCGFDLLKDFTTTSWVILIASGPVGTILRLLFAKLFVNE